MLPISTVCLLPVFMFALAQTSNKDTAAKPVGQSAETKLNNAVFELTTARNQAEAYVRRAKGISEKDTQFEAQKLYDDAWSKNNAYLDRFLDKVRSASNVDLSTPATAAADAATKFKEYVDDHTKVMGGDGVGVWGPIILKGFTTVYDEIKKRKEDERKARADEWSKLLRWPAWGDVK